MSDHTGIEWTDATWNPTTGCTKVSPACAHCYIERTPPFRIKGRKFVNGHIPLELHPDKLETPLRWKKPRRIFVNSLSDLFHEDVPDDFIDSVWGTMVACPQHTFQILTKRPARMLAYFKGVIDGAATDLGPQFRYKPAPNVWLGVSVENQHFADERIPLLLQTPAAVRFISAEPLLGPVNLADFVFGYCEGCGIRPDVCDTVRKRGGACCSDCRHRSLDWVIAGGESGPKARPSHPDWFRSLRDQCQAAGVAFHFKQWGEWMPALEKSAGPFSIADHELIRIWQDREISLRVGKKAAGRLLDGREWNEFPEARP